MWNFSNDIDIYYEYANIVMNNFFHAPVSRPYHCAYISRRWGRSYRYSHEEVMEMFDGFVVSHEPISGIFAAALGDFGYLVRSPDFKEIEEIAAYILRKA